MTKYLLLISFFSLTSCGLNPQNVNVDLNATLPEVKITTFSGSILDLGKMNRVYNSGNLNIMPKNIGDNTGTSIATSAEIPRDVTEMVKSTLNGVGGGITYIPYDPEFMLNTANTGYTEFADKVLPEVVITGGITEFDRGLVTKGESTDFDTAGKMEGKPIGLEFGDERKSSLASITLDFNLVDFTTFAGVPRMQAINNIKVHKALGEDNLGFTIYGVTAGLKGTIKKIQGRHQAVRLLVQLSMIQIIGKYQKLPYWRLIPGGTPDPVVVDQVLADFYSLPPNAQIAKLQEYLYLYGYTLDVTGVMDSPTTNALTQFCQQNKLPVPAGTGGIDANTYLAVYTNVPVDHLTVQRRSSVNRMMAAYDAGQASGGNTLAAISTAPARIEPVTQRQKAGEVRLWTNKTELNIGEKLEINFQVETPMYVRIVTVNSGGQVSTLFPNPYQSDNYCVAGKTYQIPPKGAKFSMEVGGPPGIDKIRVLAGVSPVSADLMKMNSAGEFDQASLGTGFTSTGADIKIK